MAADTEGAWLGVTKAPGDRVVLGDDDGVYSVHAALLRTGRVLLWAGGLESKSPMLFRSWTWDPATFSAGQPLTGVKAQWFLSDFDPGGSKAAPPGDNPTYADHADIDLFCAHHVTLEDGRVLAVGGTQKPEFSKGNQAVFTFNTKTEQWTAHSPGLQKQRWYPTAVVLQDGRVAIFSGRPNSGIEPTAEILESEGLKPQVISGGNRKLYIYPGMVMVRGGAIFYVPTAWQYEGATTTANVKTALGPTSSFRVIGEKSGTWTEHDDPIDPSKPLYPANLLREEGTYVLLPPAQDGRILLIGGGFALNPNSNDSASQQSTEMDVCEILHTQGGSPRWSPAGKMRRPRSNVHTVVLPDGKVLIVGGHDGAKRVHANDQLIPEMFDPKVAYDSANPSAAFTDMAAMGASRLYHATALLLPDGRVLVAGGEDQDHNHPNKHGNNHHSLEIYEPPYCHQGARPAISGIDGLDGPDDELPYGGAIDITSPEASTISSVVLMRLGSTTHHTDSEQRHVPLSFSRSGTTIRAVAVTDPSIAPPGYYMLFLVDDQGRPCKKARIIRLSHRRCTLVTDRATFSVDEIATAGTTSFAKSIYVSVDGFLPSELGVTTATPTVAQLNSIAPDITFRRGGTTQTAIRAVPAALHPEDPSLPTGRRQRITFEYAVEISSAGIFPPAGEDLRVVDVEAETTVSIDGANKVWTCDGKVRLVRTPNPYMLNGPTHWLSMDVRVFKVRSGADPYGMTTAVTNPTGYIQELLGKWTALPESGHPFEAIPEEQADSSLQLAATENGQPVYNFAVARVRYRGQSLPATDVRVFFRMFSTAATNMSYDTNATYRRHTRSGGQTVPLLGIRGGQVASIPFFAVPRVDSTTASMESQSEDGPNKQTLPPTGGSESERYFGVWLDINQGVGRFPRNAGTSNGPFSAASTDPIRDLINGRHQCLVAELYLADDPVPPGHTPANHDNLAQRNLAIEGSDNPGGPDGHTVAMTFEIVPTWNAREALGLRKATPLHEEKAEVLITEVADTEVAEEFGIETDVEQPFVAHVATRGALMHRAPVTAELWRTPVVAYRPGDHDHAAQPFLHWILPDELMIDWGAAPTIAEASLFIPGLRADDILELLRMRWADSRFEKLDENTITLPVGGMTHIPLPALFDAPLEALLTIQLPDTVQMQQSFLVRMHQVATQTRKIVGSVELRIPVRAGADFVETEARWLAVLRDMLTKRPTTDRWTQVLVRLEEIVAARVRDFGIDPDTVEANPDGFDVEPDCPPPRDDPDCPPDEHDKPPHRHEQECPPETKKPKPGHKHEPGHEYEPDEFECTRCQLLTALKDPELRRLIKELLAERSEDE